jgi:hypothetical protein
MWRKMWSQKRMMVATDAIIKIERKATVSDLNQWATNRLKFARGLMKAEQMIQIQAIARISGM